ncbi:hypothetical protein O181_097453 [Austropuccinia psidii MF-1]|uniref:Retroviral polymerase SH3-like domain-containing protein n=1 Tax=Austropuccinia psidii MF-1 TaxID=1389203 RepID=A0A9Q3J7H9_9BASI|nr:hypothetical protein [Austropuccinia psidii MF-1]
MLGYENHALAYRILRMEDRRVIISKHLKFDETYFPALISPPTSNTNREQLLEPPPNLPSPHTHFNETATNNDDVFSVWEEDFHNSQEENRPKRIKMIGPRHLTLITGNYWKTIYYLTEEGNTIPLKQWYQITINRPSKAKIVWNGRMKSQNNWAA